MNFDIIIPTNKPFEDVASLVFNLRAAQPGVRVIATCQDGNPAFNRNYGLEQSDKDAVVMVDDDICGFEPGFATELVDTLESNAQYAMVSARLMAPGGDFGPMCGSVPIGEKGISVAMERYLPTACVAFFSASHDQYVGYRFDERFPCMEDQDFCERLGKASANNQFVVNNEVRVTHLNRETWRRPGAWEEACRLFTEKWGHPPR